MAKIKIDFTDVKDLEVLVLGALGFGSAYIEAQTKRSKCQIGYRLKIAGVKRADYRNGSGPMARLVLANSRAAAVTQMQQVARSAMVKGRAKK